LKILFLSPYSDTIGSFLVGNGEHVNVSTERLEWGTVDELDPDFLLAYGYRPIISREIVERMRGRSANLHISFLPWNRGADPNFWSFFDSTPKGVTIHEIDVGLDTGRILVQERLSFSPSDTLASTYWSLRRAVEDLFMASWPSIRNGSIEPYPQPTGGTMHHKGEADPLIAMLPSRWDTRVSDVERLGQAARKR
jgi:methionyl-tRNA formyltransferase